MILKTTAAKLKRKSQTNYEKTTHFSVINLNVIYEPTERFACVIDFCADINSFLKSIPSTDNTDVTIDKIQSSLDGIL